MHPHSHLQNLCCFLLPLGLKLWAFLPIDEKQLLNGRVMEKTLHLPVFGPPNYGFSSPSCQLKRGNTGMTFFGGLLGRSAMYPDFFWGVHSPCSAGTAHLADVLWHWQGDCSDCTLQEYQVQWFLSKTFHLHHVICHPPSFSQNIARSQEHCGIPLVQNLPGELLKLSV